MLSGSIQGDAPRESFAEPLLPAPADQPEEPTRQSSEESLEQLYNYFTPAVVLEHVRYVPR